MFKKIILEKRGQPLLLYNQLAKDLAEKTRRLSVLYFLLLKTIGQDEALIIIYLRAVQLTNCKAIPSCRRCSEVPFCAAVPARPLLLQSPVSWQGHDEASARSSVEQAVP